MLVIYYPDRNTNDPHLTFNFKNYLNTQQSLIINSGIQDISDNNLRMLFKNNYFNYLVDSNIIAIDGDYSSLKSDANNNPPSNPNNTDSSNASIASYQTLNYISNNTLQLANTPNSPERLLVFVNGYKAVFSRDYTIDGNTINWVASFNLSPTDEIEVFY